MAGAAVAKDVSISSRPTISTIDLIKADAIFDTKPPKGTSGSIEFEVEVYKDVFGSNEFIGSKKFTHSFYHSPDFSSYTVTTEEGSKKYTDYEEAANYFIELKYAEVCSIPTSGDYYIKVKTTPSPGFFIKPSDDWVRSENKKIEITPPPSIHWSLEPVHASTSTVKVNEIIQGMNIQIYNEGGEAGIGNVTIITDSPNLELFDPEGLSGSKIIYRNKGTKRSYGYRVEALKSPVNSNGYVGFSQLYVRATKPGTYNLGWRAALDTPDVGYNPVISPDKGSVDPEGYYAKWITIKAVEAKDNEDSDNFQNADIALVIDSSGSMNENDPEDMRKSAAKMFIDLAHKNDQVTVVDFDDSVTLLKELCPVGDNIFDLKSAVNGIDSDGYTNINDGLQVGYEQLNGPNAVPTNQKAAILLSDGYSNRGLNPIYSIVPEYKSKGWPIYTIALSGEADRDTLKKIADETGGEFYDAPTNAVLQDIYNRIGQSITGKVQLKEDSGKISQGETLQGAAKVDDSVDFMDFLLTWPGSDLDLVLYYPDGTKVQTDPSSTSGTVDPNITYIPSDTYEIYKVYNAISGNWSYDVYAADVIGEEDYTLTISASTSTKLSASTDKTDYSTGDIVNVTVELFDDIGGIENASVNAELKLNGSTIENIVLNNGGGGLYTGKSSQLTQGGNYRLVTEAIKGDVVRQKVLDLSVQGDPLPQDTKIAIYSTSKYISDASMTKTGLSYYSDALKAEGYTVDQISRPITPEKLNGYDALIIVALEESLLDEEKSAIQNFVVNLDRGLFLAGGTIGLVNEITHLFDDLSSGGSSVEWYGQYILCDATDNEGDAEWVIIKSFSPHPITENVNRIVMYDGGYVPAANVAGKVIGVGYSDEDSWLEADNDKVYDSGETMGSQPVIAYSSQEKVVIVPDSNAFDNMDLDNDGIPNFNEYENDVLALNIVRWLTGSVSDGSGDVPLPVADLTADLTWGYAPLTVQFTDSSTGNPTSWAWDFYSDGTADSEDQNPVYTYEQAGNYSVSLTVSNEKGSSSVVKSDYIEVYDVDNEEGIKNVIEALEADGSFTTFVSAFEAANLSSTLSSEGPITIFAPTNDAFVALPEGTLDALMGDTKKLKEILLHHLVDGKLMAADVVNLVSISTLQGGDITFNVTDDGRLFVEDAEVILVVEQSDGVIYAIDSVLLPPENDENPESPSTELPDLMVQSVSRDISSPKIGDTITFEVHVYNEAPVPAGSSTLGFYVDGVEIKSEYIPELEAYSGFIQTFSWVADRVGDVQVSFVSHADFEVAEREEPANEMTVNFNIGSPDPNSGSDTPENDSSSENSNGSSSGSSSSSKSSSSSGGGGGGGGGAGSPEPASNVEVKELSQQFVTNGNHVKFGFPRNVTCITYVDFDPKRSLGKVTTIVEMLNGVSKVVSTPPSGMVYRNANIWVGNAGTASPENIENAVVGFRVEKAWIASNGVDESEIKLCRYSEEKWGELSTRKVGEDNNYIYFEAETPGFSPFSITIPSPEGEIAGSAESADEGEDIVRGISSEVSSENNSSVLEASAVEEEGAGTSGSMTKILLSFGLLSVMILIGFVVSRKQS